MALHSPPPAGKELSNLPSRPVHSTAFGNRGPSGMLWWVTFDEQSTGGEPAEQTSGKPLQEGRVVIP
jgi:hypothetical protein